MLANTTFEFGGLFFAEETVEPNSGWQAPLHRHNSDPEAWYVLEGELTFLVDGEEIKAQKGEVAHVEPGQAHTYWNNSEKPAKFILFMTPNLRDLIEAFDKAVENGDDLAPLYQRFDSELV